MSYDRIRAEEEAVQSLMELYQQSKKCQQLYERAGMGIPEALQRFLGMNGNSHKAAGNSRTSPSIPAPTRPKEPEEAQPDWIWVHVEDATPTRVALAILRSAKGPVRPKDVISSVTDLLPNVPRGSISNIGTRLFGDLIEKTDDGWKLLKPERAGIIQDGMLWGPPVIFGKEELAAQRRDAILHVLKLFPSGLQIVQIVEQLHHCSWVQAPINKDLLKADLGVLAIAKRSEATRKH